MALLSTVNGYGLASAKPVGATEGYLYYETDTSLLKRYNGTTWDTLSTVITPTGAPDRPWWQNRLGVYRLVDAQQQGTSWSGADPRVVPNSTSGTIDAEIGTVGTPALLSGGSVMYDSTPVASALVGARGASGSYYPLNNLSTAVNVDWYISTLIATHGLTDMDFMFGMANAQPNQPNVVGEWFPWGVSNPAHIGFHGVLGTTNWQIFGTHNTGSVWSKTVKDSGIALAAQTAYLLEIAYDSATNTASFYIDGSLVGTIDMSTESGPFNSGNSTSTWKLDCFVGVMSHSSTPGSPQEMECAWMRVFTRIPALEPYNGSW